MTVNSSEHCTYTRTHKCIFIKIKQACQSSLLSGRNARWPRRMLPPGESR